MADENIVQNDVQDDSASIPAETAEKTAEEKLLKQSEVDRIVGKAKHEARERAMREAEARFAMSQTAQPTNTQQQVPNQSIGGINQLNEDQVRRLIQEQANAMAARAIADKTATELSSKIDTARSKYTDYDDTLAKLKLPEIAGHSKNFVYMLNSLDNSGDVIYDIAKNPAKLGNWLALSNSHPELVLDDLRRLSESIKANERAINSQAPKDPLSQIKPSPTKTDNGSMTISDLRKLPNLRA